MTDLIKREKRITMKREMINGNYSYMVYGTFGKQYYKSNENYHIYFKNVNFKKDGIIEGTYLGLTDGSMEDGYTRTVSYYPNYNIKEYWAMDNGTKVKTARLVSLNNKTGVVTIIVHNEK